MNSGIGKALDGLAAYRPTQSWVQGMGAQKDAPVLARVPKKGFDLVAFIGRASLVAGIAANAVVAHGIESTKPTTRSKEARFSVGTTGRSGQQILTFDFVGSRHHEMLGFTVPVHSLQVSRLSIRDGAYQEGSPSSGPIRFLGGLSVDQRDRAVALAAPFHGLGIKPLVALRGSTGELIIEAGRPARSLTVVRTEERCLALFRTDDDEHSMHVEELPLDPTPAQLIAVGQHYLATEWSQET